MRYYRTGNIRNETMASCGCCWICGVDTAPRVDENEICMGKGKRKKPRKPKDKCPINRTHEWYREEIDKEYMYSYISAPRTLRYKRKTCIHCMKVVDKMVKRQWGEEWRSRPKVLPKRPVQF